jgi:hypothetical protein
MLLYMSLNEALIKNKKNLNMLQKILDLIINFNLLNDEKDNIDTDIIDKKINDISTKNKELIKMLSNNIFNEKKSNPEPKQTWLKETEEFFDARQRAIKRRPLKRMGKPLNDDDDYRRKYLQYKLKYFRLKEKNNL